MAAIKLVLTVAALLGSVLTATPAASQSVDSEAASRACAAIEQAAGAGRARLTDVVACAFREAARQLSGQMPLRIDENVTVESVAAVGAEFVYNVRVNVDGAGITPQMRRALADDVRNSACAAADMRSTIGNGGSYRYRWSDRVGRFIDETLIDRC